MEAKVAIIYIQGTFSHKTKLIHINHNFQMEKVEVIVTTMMVKPVILTMESDAIFRVDSTALQKMELTLLKQHIA